MKTFLDAILATFYRLVIKGRHPLDLDISFGRYRMTLWVIKQNLTRPIVGANIMLDVSGSTGPAFIAEGHVGLFSFTVDFHTVSTSEGVEG